MQKILFVANIHKHFNAFHIPYIKFLKSKGYEVHVAANDGDTKVLEADKQFDLPINRYPFSYGNIKAVKKLRKIIEKEEYCLIHCHTAMGSVVARVAAKKFRKINGLKVLYTAHGFHFYNGSPKLFWKIYYPMEKYLSRHTDAIITINKEDLEVVLSNQFKNQLSFKIHGVGINTAKFSGLNGADKVSIREKNNYDENTFLIIYIAEFIPRKNHKFIIESIELLKEKIDNFKFIFAGRGGLKTNMEILASQLNVDKYIDFLGFRKDIGELIWMSDIGVSVSNQEGLPMNVAEEMYASKPVLATKIRGHVDLIDHEQSGFLFNKGDKDEFVNYLCNLHDNKELRVKIGEIAKQKSKNFELDICLDEMKKIYNQFLDV